MIEFRTLGPLVLRPSDGEELRAVLTQSKRLALLGYLAVTPPRTFHRRDTLLSLFWPELDQPHARAALRKAIYDLRRALGEGVLVGRGEEEVGLDPEQFWCDVAAFDAALGERNWAGALELYRGDFLEGVFPSEAPEFERWVERERVRLRRQAAEAAWALVEKQEKMGEGARAADWARRAVALSPGDEIALRRLVELLDRLGDRAGAVRE